MTGADGLQVRGGAGGVTAALDDLDHAVAQLHRSAAMVGAAHDELQWGRSALDAAAGGLAHLGSAAALEVDLLSVSGQLWRQQLRTHELGSAVLEAVTAYRGADAAQRAAWSALLVGAAAADPFGRWALRGVLDVLTRRSDELARTAEEGGDDPAPAPMAVPPPVVQPAASLAPQLPAQVQAQLVDPAQHNAAVSALGPLAQPQPAQQPEPEQLPGWLLSARGRAAEAGIAVAGAVVAGPVAVLGARTGVPAAASHLAARARALGVTGSTRTTVRRLPVTDGADDGPPRGASDLLARVAQTGDGRGGEPGRVRVERVVTATGRRAAILYLPGTQTWRTSSSTDPLDAQTDLEAAAQEATAVSDAAVQALRAAGVGPDEDLLLVGHSLGGLAGAQMAGDPAFREQFHPVGLLTAGSPVGGFDVPADVEVVALEHADDWVPTLDGASNPDRPTLTTVTAPTPWGLGAHDLAGYQRTAEAVDASTDPSLVAARERLGEFLEAPTSEVGDYAAVRADR